MNNAELRRQIDQQFQTIDSLVNQTNTMITKEYDFRGKLLGIPLAIGVVLFMGWALIGSCVNIMKSITPNNHSNNYSSNYSNQNYQEPYQQPVATYYQEEKQEVRKTEPVVKHVVPINPVHPINNGCYDPCNSCCDNGQYGGTTTSYSVSYIIPANNVNQNTGVNTSSIDTSNKIIAPHGFGY